MPMDLELNDVHVLITGKPDVNVDADLELKTSKGASGGIGAVTTAVFLEQGAKVTAHYNSKSAPLQPLLEKWGPTRVHLAQADLIKEDLVAKLFNDAFLAFGTVQVLIINHAVYIEEPTPLQNMSLDRWRSVVDINVTASFLVAREYLRYLERANETEKSKASILVVGSSAGKFGEAFHTEYAISKSALMYGFVLSLKNEIVKIAPWGRVNSVSPGLVRTPKKEQSLQDLSTFYQAIATYPLKKVAEPYDVATQIVILSSTRVSGHISGECIMITGGMEGRLLNKRQDLGL